MQNFKKIFAIALSIMLLLCSLPLAAFADDTVTVPEMNNVHNTVESVPGTFMEAIYGAGANAYFSGNQFRTFGTFDCSNAVFFEVDVYTSAKANVSGEINLSDGTDNPNSKAAYNFGTLNKGWNHKVFTLRAGSLNPAQVGSAFLAGVFSETEDAHIIIANVAFTTDIPEVNNTYTEVAVYAGKFNGGTVPANTNAWNTCLANTNFADTDITGAKYIEMDIYVSAPVNDSEGENAEINFGYGFNDVANKNNYTFPALSIGWNHVVFDLKSNNLNFGKLNNAFMACTFSTDSNVEFKIANLSFTTDAVIEPEEPEEPIVVEIPEMNNTALATYASKAGKLSETTVPVGTDSYHTGKALTKFDALDTTGAEFIELDIYASAATDSQPNFVISSDGDHSHKNGFKIPLLEKGWNHVVLDYSNPTDGDGVIKSEVDWTFWGGVFSTTDNVTIIVANLAFTSNTPQINNTYFEVAAIRGMLSKTTVPAGVNTYPTYKALTQFTAMNVVDADYIELDIYASAATDSQPNFVVSSNGDAGMKNGFRIPLLEEGWNHVILDFNSPTDGDGVNKESVNWIFWGGVFSTTSDVEIKVANLSFTKFAPDMDNVHYEVASNKGVLMNKTYAAGANAYFAGNAFRTFGPFDASDAEYFEVDVYTSAEVNVSGEINLSDGTDNPHNKAAYDFGTLNKGWNHKVFDLRRGSLNPVQIGSAFLAGVFSETEEAHIVIANIAFTKFAPDADYDYTLVKGYEEIAFDTKGAVNSTLAFESTANLTKGEYIEFDIYTESDFADGIITLSDGTNSVDFAIGNTVAGWNHVVIAHKANANGIDLKLVKEVTVNFAVAEEVRVVVANFALTTQETVKSEMDYIGTPYAVYSGYNNVTVIAGTDIQDTGVIKLPIPANLANIDYIEFNIYVSAPCDIVLNVNSTPAEYGEADSLDSAYITLSDLTYGWNQVTLSVADILSLNGWNANDWFDAEAITNIYLSGVLSADADITVAVEDFALTVSDIDAIADGDYNADGEIDMLDLIFVKNETLADEDTWFANVAEFDGCDDGVINAIDFTALRKELFKKF